jgi:hypothetical protein
MTSMDKISLYLLLYVLIYFQIGANAGLIHNPFNAGSALSQSALQALDHFTKASIGFVIPRNEYSSSLMYMNPSIHRDFPLGLNQVSTSYFCAQVPFFSLYTSPSIISDIKYNLWV